MTEAVRVRRGGSRKKAASTGPIRADEVYALDDFLARVRWSQAALRTARRDGLKVIRAGGVGFVRGKDFFALLARIAGEPSENHEPDSPGAGGASPPASRINSASTDR